MYQIRQHELDSMQKADAMLRARSTMAARGGLTEEFQHTQMRRLKSFLGHVGLLAPLDDDGLGTVAAQLQRATFTDEDIIAEGDYGDSLYIIDGGNAVATKRGVLDENGEAKVLMEYKTEDWFGELALLGDQKRAASVRAVGEVKCLNLPRSVFEAFVGKGEDIIKRDKEKYAALLESTPTLEVIQGSEVDVRCDTRINGSMEFLTELQALPGGMNCADCQEKLPCWGSNTGALICLGCSGIHRMFGQEHSKILSVKLDAWETEEVNVMMREGNAAVNRWFEATLNASDKPKPWSSREAIEDFIYSKYVARSFCEGGSGKMKEPPWIRRVAVESVVTPEQAAEAFWGGCARVE